MKGKRKLTLVSFVRINKIKCQTKHNSIGIECISDYEIYGLNFPTLFYLKKRQQQNKFKILYLHQLYKKSG